MAWCAWLFTVLRNIFFPLGSKDVFGTSEVRTRKKFDVVPQKLKKAPFYSHIPTNQVQLYQGYVDRAFELSPTLEFEGNDPRFHELMSEAANRDLLSKIDLELMRLQYICADKYLRKKYCSNWVEKVMNRKGSDFFPDPWAIIAAVFAGNRSHACGRREARSSAPVSHIG